MTIQIPTPLNHPSLKSAVNGHHLRHHAATIVETIPRVNNAASAGMASVQDMTVLPQGEWKEMKKADAVKGVHRASVAKKAKVAQSEDIVHVMKCGGTAALKLAKVVHHGSTAKMALVTDTAPDSMMIAALQKDAQLILPGCMQEMAQVVMEAKAKEIAKKDAVMAVRNTTRWMAKVPKVTALKASGKVVNNASKSEAAHDMKMAVPQKAAQTVRTLQNTATNVRSKERNSLG
ncbi:MAG: hypothetical protein ACO1QB_05570 [Verrucomicrobiales bacterium]